MEMQLRISCLQLFAEGTSAAETGTGVEAAPAQPEQSAEEDFDSLIRGKFKQEYDTKVRNAIYARLKGSRESLDKYHALESAIPLLEQKYGVTAGDTKALCDAIAGENEKASAASEEPTTPVPDRGSEIQSAAESLSRAWEAQAEEVSRFYPGFSMETETQNPNFTALLCKGVDVRTAFEICHREEIIPAAMAYAAKEVERQLAGSLLTSGRRTGENGLAARSTAVPRVSPKDLSKAEFEEICRRVERGERISFR